MYQLWASVDIGVGGWGVVESGWVGGAGVGDEGGWVAAGGLYLPLGYKQQCYDFSK